MAKEHELPWPEFRGIVKEVGKQTDREADADRLLLVLEDMISEGVLTQRQARMVVEEPLKASLEKRENTRT